MLVQHVVYVGMADIVAAIGRLEKTVQVHLPAKVRLREAVVIVDAGEANVDWKAPSASAAPRWRDGRHLAATVRTASYFHASPDQLAQLHAVPLHPDLSGPVLRPGLDGGSDVPRHVKTPR